MAKALIVQHGMNNAQLMMVSEKMVIISNNVDCFVFGPPVVLA